ncbi:MAG: PAS domain S-box protein [Myxococcales bacterium]|nr:PAS domain S-box protein [Myxococcales bacterium]
MVFREGAADPSSVELSVIDVEIEMRKALLELGPDDVARLRAVAPKLGPLMPELVRRTYTEDLMSFAPPAAQLDRVTKEGRLESVAAKLVEAFRQQLESPIDAAYTRRRAEIGRVHARIGLEPKWYLGALNLMQQRMSDALGQDPEYGADPAKAWAAMRSLMKVVFYDIMVVLDAYIESSVGRTARNVSTAVAQSPIGVFITDKRGVIEYVNPHIEELTGFSEHELIGQTPRRWKSGLVATETYERLWSTISSGRVFESELRNRRKDGSLYWVRARIAPLMNAQSQLVGFVGIHENVTTQKNMETQLRQAERLASVGTLAAGVAHEINTPVQFVNDSIYFLRTAATDCFALIESLQAVRELAARGETGPVSAIVRSLKEFAHPAQNAMAPADLNHAIQNTLTIASSEYKYVANLEADFGELPMVNCYISDLNQVVLNLVVNAAHAIADVVGESGEKGTIRVSTRAVGDLVVVAIGTPARASPRTSRPTCSSRSSPPRASARAPARGWRWPGPWSPRSTAASSLSNRRPARARPSSSGCRLRACRPPPREAAHPPSGQAVIPAVTLPSTL